MANTWSNSFVYDGKMRRRIERDYNWNSGAWTQTNEIHFIYDGNVVIQERDANNNPLVTYTRGNDLGGTLQGAGGIGGLLARTDYGQEIPGSPTTAYYHADGNGNITMLIYTNQIIAAKYLYDPYGITLSLSGPLASLNLYRFSSKEWNQIAGLYYYLHRFYDPNLQRWPNRDPIQEAGGLNLYGYVHNNPINAIDPLGLWTFGIGLSLNFQIGPINANWSGGFVIDGQGNVGTYTTLGGGVGAGAHASGGVSFSGSNAPDICHLRKGFANANLGAGLGPDAEANGYYGNTPDGPVFGGGVTLGAGLGGGGSGGGTYTWVNPIGTW